MRSSTIVAAALGAAALGLLARGASAQALVPHASVAPTHRHSLLRHPDPDAGGVPQVLSGRSLVTAPRSGSLSGPAPLVPGRASGYAPSARANVSTSLASLGLWLPTGPAPQLNSLGAVGGNPQAVSGRDAAIAVDPTDPSTFYVAAAGGGVWKTTDAGASYTALTDFLGDTAMGCITVAPSDRNTIYAGTGEANFSGDCKYGIGLIKSVDGGASWSIIPGPSSAFVRRAISKVVVDPTNPNTVYLTIASAVNGVGGNRGVWKSADGGANWVNTSGSASAKAAGMTTANSHTALVISPSSPQTLYAAIGSPGGSAANGVYKTLDGGATYAKLTGLPAFSASTPVGQIAIAIAPSSPGTLYVSIASAVDDSLLGLYKTTDGGATFTNLTAAPNYLGNQGSYDNAVVVSPLDPNVIFAAGQVNYGAQDYSQLSALVGSFDGGQTFQDFSIGAGYLGPHTDTHALVFTADGQGLLDGNDGGVWRLENPYATPVLQPPDGSADLGNLQWTDLNANLATLQFTGIALHPTDPKTAYGGAQDNGTSKYLGVPGWTQVEGGDGGYVRVNQTNPNTVYHTFYGISLRRSDDAGQTWNDAVTGINLTDPSPGGGNFGLVDPDYRDPSAFYIPYQLDPLNQSRVILGTDHVYESLNNGDLFAPIGTPKVAGFNPSGAVVDTLGVVGQTIYAEAGKKLFMTADGGATWSDVSIPGVSAFFSDIYVNPSNPQDVITVKPSFDDSDVGKVFRSTNGGAAWNDITGNLPDIPFNAVKLDKKSGVLYVGGDDGVYATSNFGGTWSRPSGGLPTVQVVNLDLMNKTGILAAATHGRGMWTLPLSAVVAAPNVTTAVALARPTTGVAQVTLTLSNGTYAGAPAGTGAADALNAVVTKITLNGVSGIAAPATVGVVPAFGKAAPVTFTFPGVSSGTRALRFSGTYTGGSFGGSLRVAVP